MVRPSSQPSLSRSGSRSAIKDVQLDDPTEDPEFVRKVLADLNKHRTRHGVPGLKWSRACAWRARSIAEGAARCADLPTANHRGVAVFCGGPMFTTYTALAEEAITSWYRSSVGFDFKSMKGGSETAPFTSMIWRQTTHVGLAFDSIHAGVVAIVYLPAGNEEGAFEDNLRPRLNPSLSTLQPLPEPEQHELHGRVVDPNSRGIAEATISSHTNMMAWTDREGGFSLRCSAEVSINPWVFRVERLGFAPAIMGTSTTAKFIEVELLPVAKRVRFNVQNGVSTVDAESGLRFVLPPDAVIDRGEEVELMIAVPSLQHWGLPVARAKTQQGRQPLQILCGVWWSIRGVRSGILAELRPGMAAQVSFLVRPSWVTNIRHSSVQQIGTYVLDENQALWRQADCAVNVGDFMLPYMPEEVGDDLNRGELQPFHKRLDAREEADAAAAADAECRGAKCAAAHAAAVAKVLADEQADPSAVIAKKLGLISRTLSSELNMPSGAPTLDEALDAVASNYGSVDGAAKLLSEFPSIIEREITARSVQDEHWAVTEIKAGVARMGLEAAEISDDEAVVALGLEFAPRVLFREHLLSAPPSMTVVERVHHMRKDPEILSRLHAAAEFLAYDRAYLERDIATKISLVVHSRLSGCNLPAPTVEDALLAARLVLDEVPANTLCVSATMQPGLPMPRDETFEEECARLLEAFTRVRGSYPGLEGIEVTRLEEALGGLGGRHRRRGVFRQFLKELDWNDLSAETLRILSPYERSKLEEYASRPGTAASGIFMTAQKASRSATPAEKPSEPDWHDVVMGATGGKELRMTGLAPCPGWVCWGSPCTPTVVAARVKSYLPGSQVNATSSCFGIMRWHGVVADDALTVLAIPSAEVSVHVLQKSQQSLRSIKVKTGEVGNVVLGEIS